MQDFRLLIPAGIVWVVAIVGPVDYLALDLAALLIILAGVLRRMWLATIVGISLLAAAIAGGADYLVREADAAVRAIGKNVEVTGVIATHPVESHGGLRAAVDLETVTAERVMSSNVRVYMNWEGEHLERGTRFVATGRLTEASGSAAARLRVAQIEPLSDPPTARIRALLRDSVAERPWHAKLIPGVVIGDDTGLPESAVEQMRILSLSHLTAVSGAHVSLTIAVVLGIIGRRRPVVAGSLALASLAGLITLVGAESSVLRAGYMGVLMCISIALRRRSNALPLLSATILGVALLDLDLARSLGFQLSAVATLAIIVFSYPLQRRLAEHIPAVVADVAAISLIAGIATAPFLLHIQERASLWGILANALVAPVITPLTIGGMAGALLLPVAAWPATILLRACEACTWWIAWVSRTLIGMPGSDLPMGVVLAVNLALLAALVITLTFGGVRLLVGALAVLACAVGLSTLYPQRAIVGWEAIQCDVGQGAAFLARGEAGVVLVDVGAESGNVSACLKQAGVERIDLIVISHFHADHVRGLEEVLDTVDVGEIWYSENLGPDYNSTWALELLDARGVPHRTAGYGESLGELVEIVGPRTILGDESDPNADSLMVVLTTASHRILLLADAPEERQTGIVGDVEQIDVVVAGHHGARDQSRKLAEKLKPAVTIFSVGENTYGHPTEEALEIWHAPIQVRTDECGQVAMTATEVVTGCRIDVE